MTTKKINNTYTYSNNKQINIHTHARMHTHNGNNFIHSLGGNSLHKY